MKTLSLVIQKYFGLILLSVLLGIVIFLAAPGSQKAQAKPLQATRTFTIKNNCGYTIYPGIYPASTYSNGGWSMAAGAQVSFSVPDGNIGRLWGRTGCNSASPAQCTTGSCGGTGLQCAGTTGFPNTSLFEWNLNAGGTDWYDVSYVDAVDNPIGVQVSNSGCVSPNTCSNSVLTNCPADLRSGSVCLSPCTRYNTDQYCCRGAYGTAATCVVANWAASAQTYVNNIHTYCPREYAYAYDENSGGALQTCATGASYTITFCPAGGGGGGATPTRTRTPTPGGPTPTRTRTPTPGGPTPTRTRTNTPASSSQQGVDNVSSNQARAWYKCTITCSYVILHYIRPGLSQQNIQMTYNSSLARWEYLITGITSGQVLQYQFTYNDGVQHDTAWFNWTKP